MPDRLPLPGRVPIPVAVTEGKTYFWCACGKSNKQPFCDGSHKGSDFQPLSWKAPGTTEIWFCACKGTKAPPLCDGSHEAASRGDGAMKP